MLIVCPSCATHYQVEAPLLGEHGRSVRCVRCRTVWLATPSIEAVSGTEEAWPPAQADDRWAMAELAKETSASEQFAAVGDDAPALSDETAPQWTDASSEEPPTPDPFASA